MPIPLAEALVKVRLVTDKSDLKAQTRSQVDDVTKALRSQIGNLRKEARAFSVIGRDLNKIAATIFKFVVAPTIALGGLGIRKYMQTTEVGAQKLRFAMAGLHHSWDQFLARVGRVIWNSGILSKVIEKLKNFLNSLDDKKILRILEYAKWAAILGVITKIGGVIFTWIANIKNLEAALGTLQLLSIVKGGGLKIGDGGVISVTKQAAITGATAGGVGGLSVFGALKALPASFKSLDALNKLLPAMRATGHDLRHPELEGGFFRAAKQYWKWGQEGKNFAADAMTRKELTSGLFKENMAKGWSLGRSVVDASKRTGHIMKAEGVLAETQPIVTFTGWIGKILVGVGKFASTLFFLDAAASFLSGLLSGFGIKFKSGLDMLWSWIKGLWSVIKTIGTVLYLFYDEIMTGFKSMGIIIKGIITLNFERMSNELDKTYQDMKERHAKIIGNLEVPLEPEDEGSRASRERKKKDLEFLPKSISTTTFAGLQKAAQEMITQDEQKNATEENTEELKKLSETIKDWNAQPGRQGGGVDVKNYIKGTSGLESPYVNSSTVYSYGNLTNLNAAAISTM